MTQVMYNKTKNDLKLFMRECLEHRVITIIVFIYTEQEN
jgi:hypothetical protein